MADESPKRSFKEEFLPLYRGVVHSEGWRRLSVVVGGLCAAAVSVTWWVSSPLLSVKTPNDATEILSNVALSVALSFVLPWALIQLVGWVAEGFTRRNSK